MTIDRATREADPGVIAAVEAAGGVSKLAALLDIRQPSISGWKRVPAERVLEIERATEGKVTRFQMRPDLYPAEAA